MIFSLVVIIFVLIIAYWHYLQGFFSAAISAILAIIAALVAVAYQEDIVALAGGRMNDYMNAIALVVLFAVTYFLLRVLFDWAIPGNVRFPVLLDKIGAPVMGLIAGIFGVGVLVIATQTLPFGPSIAGYQRFPIAFDKPYIIKVAGKYTDVDAAYDEVDSERFLENQSQGLILGVDDIVLGTLKRVSAQDGPLSTDRPFAAVHPDYLQELFGQRIGLQSGSTRTSLPGKTTVQSVHTVNALMQVDQERWMSGTSSIGVRGKSNTSVQPLEPQRKAAEGKVLLVVRTRFHRDDADKKTGMVAISGGSVRLVAKSNDPSGPQYRNYFPIGTLEGARILYVNVPDDYLFVVADKSADLVFEVDESVLAAAADKNSPRRVASGVFLEVKRDARISLAGMNVQGGIEPDKNVEMVRKEGAPPSAIVSGGNTNTGGPKAAASPLASEGQVVMSPRLFTPINVGSASENERNGLITSGKFSLQNKKFSSLDLAPTESIQRLAQGPNPVQEFAIPPGNVMIQVPARVAQGQPKWAWASNLADFRLVDSTDKRHVPFGALAKVQPNQGAEMLGAIYDMTKPQPSLPDPGESFRPTDITLLYLVPTGTELKSLDYKEEVLRALPLKAQ